jgi:hypothetical protein
MSEDEVDQELDAQPRLDHWERGDTRALKKARAKARIQGYTAALSAPVDAPGRRPPPYMAVHTEPVQAELHRPVGTPYGGRLGGHHLPTLVALIQDSRVALFGGAWERLLADADANAKSHGERISLSEQLYRATFSSFFPNHLCVVGASLPKQHNLLFEAAHADMDDVLSLFGAQLVPAPWDNSVRVFLDRVYTRNNNVRRLFVLKQIKTTYKLQTSKLSIRIYYTVYSESGNVCGAV